MVCQNFALYPHLTVYENLAYPLRAAGLDGPAVCNRVGEFVDMLGLNHIVTRKPTTASGGEQRRVAIGRALSAAAAVVLAVFGNVVVLALGSAILYGIYLTG